MDIQRQPSTTIAPSVLPPPGVVRAPRHAIVWAAAAWCLLIGAGGVALALYLNSLPSDFGRLGRPVQVFAVGVALLLALVGLFGAVQLVRRRPAGRATGLALALLGAVACGAALLSAWGAWFAFEPLVNGIMRVPWVLVAFPLAYALQWLAGRQAPNSSARAVLTNITLAVLLLATAVVLWFAGVLEAGNRVLAAYADLRGGFASPGALAWGGTVGLVVSVLLGWGLVRLGPAFGETPFQREAWQGWLMLAPNIIGFTVFFAGPLLLSLYLSFTNNTLGSTPNVIGVRNYANVLALQVRPVTAGVNAQTVLDTGYTVLSTIGRPDGGQWVIGAKDRLFYVSMRNTLLFALFQIPLSTIPALGLALVLNSKLPGMRIFRAVYFLPSVAAVVGTALIWRWLYNPVVGFINYSITQVTLALNALPGVALAVPTINWLTDPRVVLFSMVLLSAWQVVGFNTVLFLAGLQGIPQELYEASQIDGANQGARFRWVTLPLLAPTTFFMIVTTLITILQVFNEPYTLFAPQVPIPENATTAVYYLYRRGFFFFDFGYASAVAWVLFAVIFTITLVQFRVQRNTAYE